MLEILTKNDLFTHWETLQFPSKTGCMLSDASQYFRITLDDVVPGLNGFSVHFRYIPICNVFEIPKGGYQEIIADMIPDIFREIDSSGILVNPEYVKKVIKDNLNYEQVSPKDKKFDPSSPSYIQEVKLMYFNMEDRYKERSSNWLPLAPEVFSASWKGQNLYIRVKDSECDDNKSIAIEFSTQDLDKNTITVLKNIIKYEYIFRRFIT